MLDHIAVAKIEEIQLFTWSHNQGPADDANEVEWSWFDLVILENPEATSPKVLDGRSLVWRSHCNRAEVTHNTFCQGSIFDRTHELLSLLQVGARFTL
jgi:hypothetical protein